MISISKQLIQNARTYAEDDESQGQLGGKTKESDKLYVMLSSSPPEDTPLKFLTEESVLPTRKALTKANKANKRNSNNNLNNNHANNPKSASSSSSNPTALKNHNISNVSDTTSQHSQNTQSTSSNPAKTTGSTATQAKSSNNNNKENKHNREDIKIVKENIPPTLPPASLLTSIININSGDCNDFSLSSGGRSYSGRAGQHSPKRGGGRNGVGLKKKMNKQLFQVYYEVGEDPLDIMCPGDLVSISIYLSIYM